MSKITRAQYNAYSKLVDFKGPATSKELNTTIKTMQALKRQGMVKNLNPFGDDEIVGFEHQKMKWIVDCTVIESGIRSAMKPSYMIVVGLENPIYAQILKCERSGQNLIFNNTEEAQKKADDVEQSGNCKARIVAA